MSIRSSAQIAACAIVCLAISQAALAAPIRGNGDLYGRDEEVAHAKRGPAAPKPIGPVIPSIPPIGRPVFPTLKSLHFGQGLIPTPVPDAAVAPTASTPVATVFPRFEGPLGPDIPDIPHLGPGLKLPPGFSILGQGADGSAASAAATPRATVVPRFEGQLGPDIPDVGPGFPFDGSVVPPFRDPFVPRFEGQDSGPGFPFDGSVVPPFRDPFVPRFEGQDSGPGFPFDGSIVPPFRDPFVPRFEGKPTSGIQDQLVPGVLDYSNPGFPFDGSIATPFRFPPASKVSSSPAPTFPASAATVVPRGFEGQLGPDILRPIAPGLIQPDTDILLSFSKPAVSTPTAASTPDRRAYVDLD